MTMEKSPIPIPLKKLQGHSSDCYYDVAITRLFAKQQTENASSFGPRGGAMASWLVRSSLG